MPEHLFSTDQNLKILLKNLIKKKKNSFLAKSGNSRGQLGGVPTAIAHAHETTPVKSYKCSSPGPVQ